MIQFPRNAGLHAEDLPDNMTPREAASWARYGSPKSFLKEARATGLRVWEVNARTLRIDRDELIRWKESRTV